MKLETINYGKCSKILNTSYSFFTNKIMVIKARLNKMLVRVANSEDPDQIASQFYIFRKHKHKKPG